MKTVASLALLIAVPLLGACNSSNTPPGSDLAVPRDMADLAVVTPQPDLAGAPDLTSPADLTGAPDLTVEGDASQPPDLARQPDLSGVSGCTMDSECRLYSSYCVNAPCQCIPLRKDDPDPPCMGMVNCLLDPCMKFTAACDRNTGRCIVR